MKSSFTKFTYATMALLCVCVAFNQAAAAQSSDDSFLDDLHNVSTIASTVPTNGDINPYGLVKIPKSVGDLHQGNLLVSNFNNSANLQGTGTTIMQLSPTGTVSEFAHINAGSLPGACPGGIGLTTALTVLSSGWVIVGSLPTSDGSSATAKAGCLLILNSHGNVVETISGHHINGPWDMTSVDGGSIAVLFVTNVLNGTVASSPNVVHGGTVVRLLLEVATPKPILLASTVIGSGFSERTDPGALVIGPTGVAFDPTRDTLYVADSLNNRIAAIPRALVRRSSADTGTTISSGGALNDPLGMTLTHAGHILTANGNDGLVVETTPQGTQVTTRLLNNTGGPPPGAGTLFGILAVGTSKLYFVDDGSNTLNLLH